MRLSIVIGILFILNFSIASGVFSQSNFEELKKSYPFNSETEIVNGEKWDNYTNFKGHPFWNEDNIYTGNVSFNGQVFQNLNLKYDIVDQELILFKKMNGQSKVLKLNKKFIDNFQLHNPQRDGETIFVRKQLKSDMDTHFYQQVYIGKSEGYIYHNKTINTKIRGDFMGKYLYKPVIYIKKGQNFSACRNKKSFLKIFEEQKKVLRKYMRLNQLHIDAKKPDELAQILTYYDNLNP